ncbi:MAG: tyrosine-type recombinase/integrase [Dehalococcoidia bacterium]
MKTSGLLFSSSEWQDVADVRTVRQAIALFETVGMPSRNLSARTRAEYSRDLCELAAFLEARGASRLAVVSLAHLQGYQAWMDSAGFVSSTRRRKTHTAKSFFRFLHDHGATASHLAERLIPPKAPRKEPRFLSEEEFRALLRACSHQPRDAALIELFLQTGLRLAEVARLRTTDLELPGRVTAGPDSVGLVHVVRKGGKQDSVPLNFKACRALKTWLAVRPASPSAHDALFTSKFGRQLSKRAIQALVAKYLAEAGIHGASVHSLRHTMATHHIARGTDLKTVQETLGHASLATTALYVSLAKQAQRKALQEHAL